MHAPLLVGLLRVSGPRGVLPMMGGARAVLAGSSAEPGATPHSAAARARRRLSAGATARTPLSAVRLHLWRRGLGGEGEGEGQGEGESRRNPPPPSPLPPPPSPSVPPALLDASKCPNERDDLCGALGSGENIQNGDRVVNAGGKILCLYSEY